MLPRGPKVYRSMEEFEREEINPYKKAGWSLDDLYEDATFHAPEEEDIGYGTKKELDFDF